jgi:hypothetical protein
MTTKKTFEAIAEALRPRCATCGRFVRELSGNTIGCAVHGIVEIDAPSHAQIVEGIADVFAADNPRFDRARFYRACGVEGK